MKKHIIHLNDTPFVKFTFLFTNFTMSKYLKEINSFIDSLDDFKTNNDGEIFLKNNGYNIDFEYKKEKDLKMIKVGSFFYKETKDELLIILKENSLFGVYLKNKKNNETYVVSNVPTHDSLYTMKTLYIEEQIITSKPINIIKNDETITLILKDLKPRKLLNLSIENNSLFKEGILKNKERINISNEITVKNDFVKKIGIFIDENEKKIYELEFKNCQFKKIIIDEKNTILKITFSTETLKVISDNFPLIKRKQIKNMILPSGEIDNESFKLLSQSLTDRKDLDLITQDSSKINVITFEDVINIFKSINQKNELVAIPNNVMNFNEEFLDKISKPNSLTIPKEKSNLFNVYSYEDNINDPYYDSLTFENIDKIWNTVESEIVVQVLENKKNLTKKPKL